MSISQDPKPAASVGWQNFVSSNPLVLLVGASVSVATVVAGLMTYVSDQKVDTLEIKHQTEITELKDEAKSALVEATQPLKDKLADLNFRVSSIERRLPGSGPSYFDVSPVTIGSDARNSLDSRYTSFENDGFFVAVPKDDNWTFRVTNELDFVESIYKILRDSVDYLTDPLIFRRPRKFVRARYFA
jgi:hypothetical protein